VRGPRSPKAAHSAEADGRLGSDTGEDVVNTEDGVDDLEDEEAADRARR
jgi:hypothetical protein